MKTPFPPACAARFEAERLLASGAFGSVYLARQVSLDRPAAVKILHGTMLQKGNTLTRFRDEAKITAALSHANIVEIYDHDVEDGVPWIAYEYISGGSLESMLKDLGPMPWSDVLKLGAQMAGALATAHAAGVLHRDVKPANIMVARPGEFRLADFGIAKWASPDRTSLTREGAVVGTPTYLAPSQIMGEPANESADLYALGVVLHEALAGQRLFPLAARETLLHYQLEMMPEPLRTFDPSVPEAMDALVMSLLAKRAEGRPPSATAVLEKIEEIRLQYGSSAEAAPVVLPAKPSPTPRVPGRTSKSRKALPGEDAKDDRSRRGLLIALGALVGAVAMGAWWRLPTPDRHDRGSASPLPPPPTASPSPDPPRPPADPSGMVLVPAGAFRMGDKRGTNHEQPQHVVELKAFWIARNEVTNAEYERFCRVTGHAGPARQGDVLEIRRPDRPVTGVTWPDAVAYCRWAGRRLPTEAEWEKAARGNDGRQYPWGDSLAPGRRLANVGIDAALEGLDDPFVHVAPVGFYKDGASPYGALDMAGNAIEWVSDWYAADYYARSPASDPTGPESGTDRILRGGHYHHALDVVRTFVRVPVAPTQGTPGEVGFRTALSAELKPSPR